MMAGLPRRRVVQLAGASLASVVLSGHTPYGQWTIYRQRNLFIVASRTDRRALELARAVAAGLARELPDSHARFTRASDPVRIASLLATGQLDVAIVAREDAAHMLAGAGRFRAIGSVAIRLLAELEEHLLVTVKEFRDHHAFLLAEAIEHLRGTLPVTASTGAPPIPLHPGASAFRAQATRGSPANGAPGQ